MNGKGTVNCQYEYLDLSMARWSLTICTWCMIQGTSIIDLPTQKSHRRLRSAHHLHSAQSAGHTFL
jgi:hypothetical protein